MIILGMISGTSYDGIDCSMGEFTPHESEIFLKPLFTKTFKYPEYVYSLIDASMPPEWVSFQRVCELDVLIGKAFAEAALEAIKESGKTPDLIVSHGQTMYHWISPEGTALGTLQLGDPSRVSEATGIAVLSHPRSQDVAAGGQGAPFASLIDHMLLNGIGKKVAALNLGGISNITIVKPGSETTAYDIGPANALIDAAVRIYSSGKLNFDDGGALGMKGKIDEELLTELLKEPYYALRSPKSTGKELFNHTYLTKMMESHPEVDLIDLIATLTALTAKTVTSEINKSKVDTVYVSGGGKHNRTLMGMMRNFSPNARFAPYEELGVNSDGKEAYLFGLIGFLSSYNQNGNIPSSTGAAGGRILGSLNPGKNGFPTPLQNAYEFTSLRII